MEAIHEYGFWSILPPIVAIILAIRTKQVFVSLLFGIWLGWVIINGGNLLTGTLDTIQSMVDVFKDAGNTRTIMFCVLVGALIIFIQRSGGVEGFILKINKVLEKYEAKKRGNNRIVVQFLAWLTGLLIFVESSISVLTVGALYRPVFDKLNISREKLAYIADSSSAPSSILIPFNGWGAFIMGLLAADFANPFGTMMHAMVYNFYPVFALLLVLYIIFSGNDFGPMKAAERRAREEGKVLADDAQPMVSEELTEITTKEGLTPKARNMIVPIVIMVLMMPIMLTYTGWDTAMIEVPESGFFGKVFYAIGNGSGSTAVLVAVLTSLIVSMIFYRVQGIMNLKEMIDLTLKGIAGLMPLAILMMFAFAISSLCRYHLHTGEYVADIARGWLSPSLVPFIVFVVSCFIAFSIGSSWGTFGIMLAIAIPMAKEMDANVYIAIAAVMGGGVFGDHCSPISDTTILSSMASASDHIDHVKTQLPYAMIAGGAAAILYLIVGFLG
ncbi:MAG: sodium:solute symporter [Bacteroidetes bacterium]|jgi:Na+/H+ antiporter NhaC|nr:sodium:solute symporter [Bacteroidota bacterium]MDF1864507.1 Na+/H+ antiporter NhaC family protein [Saprospiraceae bacterium]